MAQALAPDQPTTDRVTRWDRLIDQEFARRLREADEELARRENDSKPPTPPMVGWDPSDCL